jgi:hypothetical protein
MRPRRLTGSTKQSIIAKDRQKEHNEHNDNITDALEELLVSQLPTEHVASHTADACDANTDTTDETTVDGSWCSVM